MVVVVGAVVCLVVNIVCRLVLCALGIVLFSTLSNEHSVFVTLLFAVE